MIHNQEIKIKQLIIIQLLHTNKQFLISNVILPSACIMNSFSPQNSTQQIPASSLFSNSSRNNNFRVSHPSGTPPKQQYKGMTLKEYFMLQNNQPTHPDIVQELQQENYSQKDVQTPAFNNQPSPFRQHYRVKMKTQVNDHEEQIEKYHKNNHIRNVPTNFQRPFGIKYSVNASDKKSPNLGHYINMGPPQNQDNSRLHTHTHTHVHKKSEHKKVINQSNLHLGNSIMNQLKGNQYNQSKLSTTPSKAGKIALNRSTLTSFYQLDMKKKKIMDKIKADKNRGKELKLSDAFFITKYGSKFDISCKKMAEVK